MTGPRDDDACPGAAYLDEWAKGGIETTTVVDDMHCGVEVATAAEIEALARTIAWLARRELDHR